MSSASSRQLTARAELIGDTNDRVAERFDSFIPDRSYGGTRQEPATTTIGLCMIVKNESHVVTRCLDSVRPLVDYVLIEDTGSTDGTQQIIADWLKRANMPGMVIEEPWRDFAYNRSHVMAKLREVEGVDYALIIDADDQLLFDKGTDPLACKAGMRDDLYDVQIRHGGSRFFRPQLCNNKRPFHFKAVLHEYLEGPPGPVSRSTAVGFHIETGRGGARSQNPRKYQEDAAVLANALQNETDPFLISRYTFYLAQSYRDCGENEKALEHYLARAELGFWTEEIFESVYSAGVLMEKLGRPDTEIIGTYLKAYGYSPGRAESLRALVNYCHRTGKAPLGYLIGKSAITKSIPPTGLFVQQSVYDYAMLDDFAVAAYWAGEFRDCLDACEKLLAGGNLPPEHRARVEANANFAKSKLSSDPDPGEQASDEHSPELPYAAHRNTGRAMTVFVVKPPNYSHWEAYRELSETVFHGLQKLGFDVIMTSDIQAINGRPIVIGAHVASSELMASFPDDAIIYNSEHVTWIESADELYTNLLRRHEVWDYSQDNAERLSKLLGKSARFVKLGYVRELTRIEPQSEQDIDVLFIGSWKGRRQAVLDGLRQAGLKVHQAFGVYGRERDSLVARSKVILNMHLYEPGAFEIVRVSYMLANRKAVVTEANPGEVIDDDLINGMVAVPYDRLVGAVSKLVEDDSRRAEMEEAGFKAFAARDESRVLKEILGESVPPGRTDIRLERCEFADAKGVSKEASVGCERSDDIRLACRTMTRGTRITDMRSRRPAERPADVPTTLSTYFKLDRTGGPHTGVPYIEFLKLMGTRLNPRSYLEIGTQSGISLRQFDCDALCIDPAFQITQDALLGRKRTFFFQMTSDDFFLEYDARAFFPKGVDIGFLDGLHHFEALLKDFINFERCCHKNSIAILHDCLPTDLVMTSREFQWAAWTGDVWKILPALKRYRPDLRILLLDCPPTGLVVCCGLDAKSSVLQDHFGEVVDEYSRLVLDEVGLTELRSTFPLVDTSRLVECGGDISLIAARTAGNPE